VTNVVVPKWQAECKMSVSFGHRWDVYPRGKQALQVQNQEIILGFQVFPGAFSRPVYWAWDQKFGANLQFWLPGLLCGMHAKTANSCAASAVCRHTLVGHWSPWSARSVSHPMSLLSSQCTALAPSRASPSSKTIGHEGRMEAREAA
jgi:hypothetical protein